MNAKDIKEIISYQLKIQYGNKFKFATFNKMYPYRIGRFFSNFNNQKVSTLFEICEILNLEICVKEKESSKN